MGRLRVLQALHKIKPERTPRGEILIEEAFLQQAGMHREELLEKLQADLVTLPIDRQSNVNWGYWSRRGYFTFALINGPFHSLIETLGWSGASPWIVGNPDKTRAFMDSYLDTIYPAAARALDGGCEGLILGDDLAGNNGLLVAPSYLRQYYFTELGRWLQKIQAGRNPVLFHSDGDVMEIIPDLKELGFWGLHGLQPDAGMGAAALAQETTKDWAWWGNFQFEGVFSLKNPCELETEAADLGQRWEGVPGYIFGSCGGLYPGLPVELVLAAYRSLK